MSLRGGKGRLPHVHNFRGLAIAFIVATHCVNLFDWSGSPLLKDVVSRVVANGTIFFLFIAGYLFEYLSPGFRVVDYWRNKSKNVVLPYIIVSLPALLIFTVFLQRDEMREGFYDQPRYWQAAEFLLTGGHLAPFWFIPTIVVFYLAAPLIRQLFRHDRMFLALPVLILIGALVSRGDHQPLQSFVHFLPVWVLGMACCRFAQKVDPLLQRWMWLLPLLVIVLFAAEMAFTRGTHSWYSDIQKDVLSVFLLEVFRRLGTSADKWMGELGTLSFGIFFLHSYVITAMRMAIEYLVGHKPEGGVLQLALAAIVAAVLTICAVRIGRMVLKSRSRMVIGV